MKCISTYLDLIITNEKNKIFYFCLKKSIKINSKYSIIIFTQFKFRHNLFDLFDFGPFYLG